MKYQIVITVRAKDGDRAVSANLLPPLVAVEGEEILPLLLAMQTMVDDKETAIVNLGHGDMYGLAAKVEADVEADKYKWTIHK